MRNIPGVNKMIIEKVCAREGNLAGNFICVFSNPKEGA